LFLNAADDIHRCLCCPRRWRKEDFVWQPESLQSTRWPQQQPRQLLVAGLADTHKFLKTSGLLAVHLEDELALGAVETSPDLAWPIIF